MVNGGHRLTSGTRHHGRPEPQGLIEGRGRHRRAAPGTASAGLPALPRRRMGPARRRRPPAVREDLPRRVPVRPLLADHPQEARELSAPPSPASTSTRSPRFGDADVERLLADAGIVRHRGKIVSTINNAARAHELVDGGRLARGLFLELRAGADERPKKVDLRHAAANPTTPASSRISKDLKKRGWTFVGPTTVYAFMQAMGLVNDHLEGCFCRAEVEAARQRFARPA